MAKYENTSLVRGMAILEALGEAGEPRTLTDIATLVGLARSTAFRLLAVLRDLGFVHKNARDGLYSLGFNAYRLGQTSRAVDSLVRDAHPFLRRLAHDTGLTTYLAALEGPQVLVCDVIQPPDGLKLPFEMGVRIDAHACAAGKALLATRPEDEIAEYFAAHAPRRYTDRTLSNFDALRRDLGESRVKGFAVERGEMRADLEALAVTITSKLDRPIQAIATVGPVPQEADAGFRQRLERMRRTIDEFYDYRITGDVGA